MNARKILKILNYLPRWAWYLLSFFIGGPFGILIVYLVFHVLRKIEKEQQEEEDAYYDSRHSSDVYYDEECTVMDEDELNRRWQQTEASAARAAARQQRKKETVIPENASIDDVIRIGYEALQDIHYANDVIADEALSAQIDSIEQSCSQILLILEQRPQLLSQLRSFLRYYLPTTLRLLDARARLENNAGTPKAREIRGRISEAVGAIDKAFVKQAEALDAYRFLDLESEMDVLRDMLKADGLVDDEQQNDDPFASVLGGK